MSKKYKYKISVLGQNVMPYEVPFRTVKEFKEYQKKLKQEYPYFIQIGKLTKIKGGR